MKITFIGLGIMGSQMASHLLKGGVDLTVFNRSKQPMKLLEEKGAKTSEAIEEAVKDADIVFSMLSRPEVVESLMIKKGVTAMKKSALWVDCSTVNPSFTHYASDKAKSIGINYLEAPVAGSKPQVEAAELVFFVGGEKSLLEKLTPFLQMMGTKVLHLGEIGKGASFKMVVNTMLGISMLAFAESIQLGKSLGLDERMLLDTVPNLPVSAPFLKMKAERIKEGNDETQFPLELLQKDLNLATLSTIEKNLELPFTHTAEQVYFDSVKKGNGRKDMAAIYDSYK